MSGTAQSIKKQQTLDDIKISNARPHINEDLTSNSPIEEKKYCHSPSKTTNHERSAKSKSKTRYEEKEDDEDEEDGEVKMEINDVPQANLLRKRNTEALSFADRALEQQDILKSVHSKRSQ